MRNMATTLFILYGAKRCSPIPPQSCRDHGGAAEIMQRPVEVVDFVIWMSQR
jgi:hypothetical protein